MSLIDRVLSDPEIAAAPPVLADVGAAGGVSPLWRRIARHAVVLAFEPDVREAAPLSGVQAQFRRWIYVPAIVVPEPRPNGQSRMFLTRSPQCSSTLLPRTDALRAWDFSGLFKVIEQREFPATTLAAALGAHGLAGIDWLKCDTQGMDLRIFRSLPEAVRHRVLLTEFEPGMIPAYEGEDSLADVLAGMSAEPFWLADFKLNQTARAMIGAAGPAWYRRLAPCAPGWANLRYFRDVEVGAGALDRRAFLMLWAFAALHRDPVTALATAQAGGLRFPGPLFAEMARASEHQLRRIMVRNFPAWLWQRIFRIS